MNEPNPKEEYKILGRKRPHPSNNSDNEPRKKKPDPKEGEKHSSKFSVIPQEALGKRRQLPSDHYDTYPNKRKNWGNTSRQRQSSNFNIQHEIESCFEKISIECVIKDLFDVLISMKKRHLSSQASQTVEKSIKEKMQTLIFADCEKPKFHRLLTYEKINLRHFSTLIDALGKDKKFTEEFSSYFLKIVRKNQSLFQEAFKETPLPNIAFLLNGFRESKAYIGDADIKQWVSDRLKKIDQKNSDLSFLKNFSLLINAYRNDPGFLMDFAPMIGSVEVIKHEKTSITLNLRFFNQDRTVITLGANDFLISISHWLNAYRHNNLTLEAFKKNGLIQYIIDALSSMHSIKKDHLTSISIILNTYREHHDVLTTFKNAGMIISNVIQAFKHLTMNKGVLEDLSMILNAYREHDGVLAEFETAGMISNVIQAFNNLPMDQARLQDLSMILNAYRKHHDVLTTFEEAGMISNIIRAFNDLPMDQAGLQNLSKILNAYREHDGVLAEFEKAGMISNVIQAFNNLPMNKLPINKENLQSLSMILNAYREHDGVLAEFETAGIISKIIQAFNDDLPMNKENLQNLSMILNACREHDGVLAEFETAGMISNVIQAFNDDLPMNKENLQNLSKILNAYREHDGVLAKFETAGMISKIIQAFNDDLPMNKENLPSLSMILNAYREHDGVLAEFETAGMISNVIQAFNDGLPMNKENLQNLSKILNAYREHNAVLTKFEQGQIIQVIADAVPLFKPEVSLFQSLRFIFRCYPKEERLIQACQGSLSTFLSESEDINLLDLYQCAKLSGFVRDEGIVANIKDKVKNKVLDYFSDDLKKITSLKDKTPVFILSQLINRYQENAWLENCAMDIFEFCKREMETADLFNKNDNKKHDLDNRLRFKAVFSLLKNILPLKKIPEEQWIVFFKNVKKIDRKSKNYPFFLLQVLQVTSLLKQENLKFDEQHKRYRAEIQGALNDPNFMTSDALRYFSIELYDEDMLKTLTHRDNELWNKHFLDDSNQLQDKYVHLFGEKANRFLETYREKKILYAENSPYKTIYHILIGDEKEPVHQRVMPKTPWLAIQKATEQAEKINDIEKTIRYGALGGSDLKPNKDNHFKSEWIGISALYVYFLGYYYFRFKKDPCYAKRAFFTEINKEAPVLVRRLTVLVMPYDWNKHIEKNPELRNHPHFKAFTIGWEDGHGLVAQDIIDAFPQAKVRSAPGKDGGVSFQLFQHHPNLPSEVITELANAGEKLRQKNLNKKGDAFVMKEEALLKSLAVGHMDDVKTYVAVPATGDNVILPFSCPLKKRGDIFMMRPPYDTEESARGIHSSRVHYEQASPIYGNTLQVTLTGMTETREGVFAKGLATGLARHIMSDFFGEQIDWVLPHTDIKLRGYLSKKPVITEPTRLDIVTCIQRKQEFSNQARIVNPTKDQLSLNGDYDGDEIHVTLGQKMPELVKWMLQKSEEINLKEFKDAELKPPKQSKETNLQDLSWIVQCFQVRYPMMGNVYQCTSKILNAPENIQHEMAEKIAQDNLFTALFPEKAQHLSNHERMRKEIVLLCKLSTDLFKTTVPFSSVYERILLYQALIKQFELSKPVSCSGRIVNKVPEGENPYAFFGRRLEEDAQNFPQTFFGKMQETRKNLPSCISNITF